MAASISFIEFFHESLEQGNAILISGIEGSAHTHTHHTHTHAHAHAHTHTHTHLQSPRSLAAAVVVVVVGAFGSISYPRGRTRLTSLTTKTRV